MERNDRAPSLPASSRSTDYGRVLDSIDVIVWEADPVTFQFSFVSPQAERMLGHPVEAWLAPGFWLEHVHPSDREWAVEFCKKATEAGDDHAFEYRILAADGRVVWLRDVVSVELESGRPIRSRGVMVDVTERRRSEEARQAAELRLRAVVSNAPVVLFALDAEGRITVCEGQGLEGVGVDPSTVVGRFYTEQNAEIRESMGRALAGDTSSQMVKLRGHTFDTSYSTVRDDAGEFQGVIGVGTDITERLLAQRERESLEAQVRHAQKLESLGVLAGGIAHDFSNVLTSVLGNADLALLDIAAEAPGRMHVERIRGAGHRLSELTNQLLAYSGKGTFVVEFLDLARIIAEMDPLLQASTSKGAVLRYELADDLPAIEGDPSQIGQVVMNLVTNASDALGDSDGVIVVRAGVVDADRDYLSQSYVCEDCTEGRYVFIEVSDSGVGMEPENLARIFDPFFTTKFTGRGLGLAVVLGIVRGHRGAIRVDSEPGRGTRFRILLPCAPNASPLVAEARESPSGWRGSGTVLVVDDEHDVRQIAEEMLRRSGLEVLTAVDGRTGLDVLDRHAREIDLVLLDLTMPGMAGEEVLEEIQRTRPALPVLLMSGYSEQHSLSRCEGRIAGFLKKPFSREQLSEALRATLSE